MDGGSIFYEVTGKGDAVVLIHGGMLDHRAWKPQVEALARRYRVVTYDVAGHGQSPAPEATWKDFEQLLLHTLGPGKTLLFGHLVQGPLVRFYNLFRMKNTMLCG